MNCLPRKDRWTNVLLAHPGTQHSHHGALALQQAGLLKRYVTGFYFNPESAWARVLRRLPEKLSAKLDRELYRRFTLGLAPENIQMFPAAELLYIASGRLALLRPFSDRLLRWRNDRFDRQVAQIVATERPAAVMCYDTCALRAFEKAKQLGVFCMLDQSVGHVCSAAKLFEEERQLHPDFADTLPAHVPEALIERCTREARLADAILSPSEYVRQSLLRIGVETSRILSMPYGVDSERFRPAPKRLGKKFRVLFVGQLSQRKGIKYLLEAFRQLRLPKAELVLVGQFVGPGKGLERYRDCFTRIPNIPKHEVHIQYQQADIFVYPSLHEGSALSIYEALACGLPVITTPNSGSVVRDGIHGFVVPIRDVEVLKEKIVLLYENHQLRQSMAEQARRRAEMFTWAAYQQRLEGAFAEMLQASRTARCAT